MLRHVPRVYTSSKSKILDAAEQVILRDGPKGLSVDAVLREANVSKGGFFHHFATKEALLGALMDRLAAGIEEQAAALVTADTRSVGRVLRAQISLVFDMPPRERERTRALVLALLSAVLDQPRVAQRARRANEVALASATRDGVGLGPALVVQLALDGYFLGESFGTLKLDAARKLAIRETLLSLVVGPKRGRNAR
jgi:AcrR family transcriptional regulator